MAEPEVYLIAKPTINYVELQRYLWDVGGQEWEPEHRGPAARLAEFAGRLCYRSWKPGLNPNVRKIRKDGYLANILAQKHGSVLEHLNYSFVFANVSRVFTHELVRHRAGCAISQESGRFVRLGGPAHIHDDDGTVEGCPGCFADPLSVWLPDWVKDSDHMALHAKISRYLKVTGDFQEWLAKYFHLDDPGVSFAEKKAKTSFMRRFAPEGRATHIMWTANVRALRHVIEMRTAPGAEEEIRLVFAKVAKIMTAEAPALFQDFEEHPGGIWQPVWSKV